MKFSEYTRILATPLAMAASLITVTTGVLMFFNIDRGLNRLAHEWVSMLLALAIGLHVWRNWNSFVRLLTTSIGKSLLILGLVVLALSFLKLDRKPNEPAFIRATHTLLDAPLSKSLPVIGLDDEAFVNVLNLSNISVNNQDVSLRDIALRNKIHPFELVDIVLDGPGVTLK